MLPRLQYAGPPLFDAAAAPRLVAELARRGAARGEFAAPARAAPDDLADLVEAGLVSGFATDEATSADAGPRGADDAADLVRAGLVRGVDARAGARGVDVREDVGVEALADLLAAGKVVGVVRGRMEFGPRALGHRSLLADPSRPGSKDRLNAIKHREWWRPTAPVVAREAARDVFETLPRSPYMSFAPRLTAAAAAALPGIHHFDGTARPQVVAPADEPWLHALLAAVARRTGWAVLINTSFNTKGRPILNTAAEALALLESDGLDAVLIEATLVLKR